MLGSAAPGLARALVPRSVTVALTLPDRGAPGRACARRGRLRGAHGAAGRQPGAGPHTQCCVRGFRVVQACQSSVVRRYCSAATLILVCMNGCDAHAPVGSRGAHVYKWNLLCDVQPLLDRCAFRDPIRAASPPPALRTG